ncbi:hypothetical protein Pmar_PMAR009574 [Perkinsus marinus ATCC 50983]|uniref:START domain-containing protein n=1 Tax=Perkinsus marinus (strain ATCC 50983 / TXsc) TaxID=423536 RepID=C5KEK1_PERM5|nr:hypothetical protein Pmar_PMAR009574 [Perkinsus marinus ATCC 50983]EER17139.1 hypothetical protein Pmar_PMAR009574 [Perkinsus marinus ATCC 50983]|eukprot:XP_002785343.1 hypothetical protein Pmar_PMAR009574 [Perkinsus marinus ATCC 50983]
MDIGGGLTGGHVMRVVAAALVTHEIWRDMKKDNAVEGGLGSAMDGGGSRDSLTLEGMQRGGEAMPAPPALFKAPVHMSFLPMWQVIPWPSKGVHLPPVTTPPDKVSIPGDVLERGLHASREVLTQLDCTGVIQSSNMGEDYAASRHVDSVEASSYRGLKEEFDIPSDMALPPRVHSLLDGVLSLVSDEMATDPDVYLPSHGWQRFKHLEKDGQYTCTIWRKELLTTGGKSPTAQWMMTGDIAVTPAQFHALNVDIDNRASWDSTFEGARKEDEKEDDGSSTLVWKAKWPWPFSSRLYRYRQIPLVLPNDDTRAMLSLGLQQEGGPGEKDDSLVRVTDYISLSCIKPNVRQEGKSSLQSRYCLYYYDDPKVGASMPAWLERNVAESTLPKLVSNIVTAVSNYPLQRLEKYKDVGLRDNSVVESNDEALSLDQQEMSPTTLEVNTLTPTPSLTEHQSRRRTPPYATPIICQWLPPAVSGSSDKGDDTKPLLLPCPFLFTPLDVVVTLYEDWL